MRAVKIVSMLLVLVCIATGADKIRKRFPTEATTATTKSLGGEKRLLTYLSTDKPVYRAGEKVYLRAVVLDAQTNIAHKDSAYTRFEIKNSKGAKIFGSGSGAKDSVAAIAWQVPAGQAGGVYTAIAKTNGGAQAQRKFEIRSYQPPRLKTQIEFIRKGYGAGDKVSASVNVKRAEGGLPKGAKVTAVARVDGKEVFRKADLVIDAQGNTGVSFNLPKEINVGDGTLSFIIEDGGVLETAAKTIPILLQTMDISFYPEGGELIAGLPCRVYVQANRPDGKPADIAGEIYQKGSSVAVADIKTVHEGRGKFTFTPNKGKEYVLRLIKPSGITKQFDLPKVHSSGAVLKADKLIYKFDEKISFSISSTKDSGAKYLKLYKREKLLDSVEITTGKRAVSLDAKDAEGVLIATLYDSADKPLAERLVMREPKFKVDIKVTADRKSYVPGGKVKLEVMTTDESGKAIEAVVGLVVTDESVLEMIDKREQAPNLPVMVYLENEVEDLADAHVYFDTKNKNAARDVDLLLGTQGWRRFILVDYAKIKEKYPQQAKRAMAEMRRQIAIALKNKLMRMNAGVAQPAAIAGAIVEDKVNVDAAFPLEEEIEVAGVNVKAAVKKERAGRPAVRVEALKEIDDDMYLPVPERDRVGLAKRKRSYVYIRQYAHKVRPNRQQGDRKDFTETVYWNAAIRTNPRSGKATVEFDLSDSVTSFAIKSDAFGSNGALGASYSKIESKEPFYIEPKMPQAVTVGDVIELPVSVVNGTDNDLEKVNVIAEADGLDITQVKAFSLKAQQRGRRVIRIKANKVGLFDVVLKAAADGYVDKVTRSLKVMPKGFEVQSSQGGLIEAGKDFRTRIDIPVNVEAESIKAQLQVYPSPLASMEEALNALLRQPYGCFEQTSSTTYPLVMAQQYFLTHQGVRPDKIKKARELLEKGYKRLISFESKDKGYEWFGGNPAHEALTAYGLMEFVDMAKVMPIDKKMLADTKRWLLSRRDGKGGFKRNTKGLDSFGRAPQLITNAYIVWALLESGENPQSLQREIAAIKEKAQSDTYFLALAANIMYLAGDNVTGDKIASQLVAKIEEDGSVGGAETSITRSGGLSLKVETTALAVLAWLKNDDKFAADVERSMKWLFESCKSGRFGSTQSTILALKAINAYDKARSKPKAAGSLQLYIDGKKFGKAVEFTKETKETITMPDFSAALTDKEHTIELKMTDGSKMPFSFTLVYNTPKPDSAKKCDLELKTKLAKTEIIEGEPLELNVNVKVKSQNAPTPIAIIGVPGGLEPRHDQLKELVGAGRIASYEIKGRYVVLYWRALKAGEDIRIPLSLTARVPGEYSAPASRAYLYYTDEYKDWQGGVRVKVLPKAK